MRIKEGSHGHLVIVFIGFLMLVLIVHMCLACHSLMDWLDKGSMCGHLQVHGMKQLDIIIIITHYYLNTPVPVLTLHSPGPMKFPLMLVTVTSVTLVLILIMVISTRSSWTTLSGKVRAVMGLALAAGSIIHHGFVSN